MSGQPQSLFRGTELPRLLFLLAIVIVGWPAFMLYTRPAPQPQPRAVIVPATRIKPVIPDNGIEFQAIQDKTPIQLRETAAYATLLERARNTSAADLAKDSRRDIFFTHVWERPEKYRGVPVHLQGVAKKILTYEVEPTLAPSQRLYEIWFYTDENRYFPNVAIIQDPPAGLLVGDDLNLRVTIDGYFMKLMKYRAGDTNRAAPLFIGRMEWTPIVVAPPSSFRDLGPFSRRYLASGVFILALGSIAIRVFLQIRKIQAQARPQSTLTGDSQSLPPEDLAKWLQEIDEPNQEDRGDQPPR
jgi:hypothetical protein